MEEKVFDLIQSDHKIIEKIIVNEHLHYMHVILLQHEGLPLHQSNANVYMTVVQGRLSIGLNEGKTQIYPANKLLSIPYKTKMNVRNDYPELLELIIIKTPAPGDKYYI